MPRPPGHTTDKESLELWEYRLIIAKLPGHWRVFYQVKWQTGTRVGEVLAIGKRDIEDGGVWVTSDKRGDRIRQFVRLTTDLYRLLQDLAAKQREAYVFPYTPQAAWLALRKAAKEACIRAETIHSHLIISPERRRIVIREKMRYTRPTAAEVRDAFRNIKKSQ